MRALLGLGVNKTEIRQINILTYMLSFDAVLPAIASHYAKQQAFRDDGLCWGAYTHGQPSGVCIAEDIGNVRTIHTIAVNENFRRRGVCRSLLDECIQTAATEYIALKYVPETSNDYFDVFLKKCGFTVSPFQKSAVVSVSEQSKAEWDGFMNRRGGKLLKRLHDKGYRAVSFTDAEKDILDTLYAEMGVKFPSNLDPRKCPNEVINSSSFITMVHDRPTAYCVSSTADSGQTAIIEYMASSANYRGTGAFLLCLASSIEGLKNKSRKVAFAYSERNQNLPSLFISGIFSDMTVKAVNHYAISNHK